MLGIKNCPLPGKGRRKLSFLPDFLAIPPSSKKIFV
jgi:hypothetical protein